MAQAATKPDYRNPFAFAIRRSGSRPEAPWYQGNGTMRIQQQPHINSAVTGTPPFWQTFSLWQSTRNWRPIQWAPHLGARAALTSNGWPSTWFTLRLPLAQPDLQTALSRRYRPVVQAYTAAGGANYRIPAAFVPVRPTGPGNFTGGQGSTNS